MNKENIFAYNTKEYKDFLKEFRALDGAKHMLIVFAGEFDTNRKAALDELKREVYDDASEIDLSEDIITPFEEESYRNIDECVESLKTDASLVIFRNAEQLNGAYTGFTSSVVKYATPQEKYFLKKIKELKVPVVLEFKDKEQLDPTVTRTADAVVKFPAPTSFIEKLAWKVKNVHVHGSHFLSPRPE